MARDQRLEFRGRERGRTANPKARNENPDGRGEPRLWERRRGRQLEARRRHLAQETGQRRTLGRAALGKRLSRCDRSKAKRNFYKSPETLHFFCLILVLSSVASVI